jgi:hypothetical protein
LKSKLTDELITALLEVMNIPKSGYIEASLREKLAPLNPKHYTEVMMNLMDNQDRYAKPLEKVATAIQKSLDRYCHPKTVDELLSLFKRSYRGRVISDECATFYKGVKIAVSADGDHLVNLYNCQKLNEADTIEVIEWCLDNPEKIGVDNKHVMIEQQSKLGSAYGDIVEQPLIGNVQHLIADLSSQKRG